MGRTPDDPSNEPTQMADYQHGRVPSYDAPPTPWYFRPVALIGLGVLTALLIALLVWGMVRLVHQESGSTTPPTTSVSSTPVAPTDESIPPSPQPVAPVAPVAPTDENPPPETTTEPSTPVPPTTTESPTSTPSTTEPPTTTEPPSSTTAPSTTTEPATTTTAPRPPSEIVIPLPPWP